MPFEIPQPIDYSKENRKIWAENPLGDNLPRRTIGCWPISSGRRSPAANPERLPLLQGAISAAPRNRYEVHSDQGFNWADGDFVISLDTFLQPPFVDPYGRPPIKKLNNLSFGAVGCQGVNTLYNLGYCFGSSSNEALETIGKELRDITKSQFNFLLGDNFYHFGVTSPRSPLFHSCFFAAFTQLPSFAILGNHDYNMHSQARISEMRHPRLSKLYRAMCQVYHSYDPSNTQNLWNMPFRYYVLVSQSFNTVFMCIDSNSFVFDQVQQQWFYETYQKLNRPNRQGVKPNFILISHHPLEYYSSRALKKNEWKKYVQTLPGENVPQVPAIYKFAPDLAVPQHIITGIAAQNNSQGTTDTMQTIGHYIKLFLEQNNLRFGAIIAAHEHLMAVEKIKMNYAEPIPGREETTTQFVCGAGGSELKTATPQLSPTNVRPYYNPEYVFHRAGARQANYALYGCLKILLDRENQLRVSFRSTAAQPDGERLSFARVTVNLQTGIAKLERPENLTTAL